MSQQERISLFEKLAMILGFCIAVFMIIKAVLSKERKPEKKVYA